MCIRDRARYPRDIKPSPPSLGGVWSLEDTEWILMKIARLRGSSDAFRAQDSDPGVFKCVKSVFGASENRKPQKCAEAKPGVFDLLKIWKGGEFGVRRACAVCSRGAHGPIRDCGLRKPTPIHPHPQGVSAWNVGVEGLHGRSTLKVGLESRLGRSAWKAGLEGRDGRSA